MALNVEAEYMDGEAGGSVQVIGADSLAAITRGEIDVQIATAKKYPRSLAQFKKRAIEMATFDEETAESCIYSRPVGKKKNEKGIWEEAFADGLSIRMAEIVAANYGNLRVMAMITEQTPEKVVARGACHDLESNLASSIEVAESTMTSEYTDKRTGAVIPARPYSERMRMVVAKATLAKAWRDAVFKVVPKALARPIEAEVRKLLAGDGSAASMTTRRAKVMTWVRKLGIDINRVFAALGIKGEDDMGMDEMDRLTGIKTALKDKEITIDEAFPFEREVPQDKPSMPQPKAEVVNDVREDPPAKVEAAEEISDFTKEAYRRGDVLGFDSDAMNKQALKMFKKVVAKINSEDQIDKILAALQAGE